MFSIKALSFENFDNDNKDWELITDNVMGGVSFGKFDFIKDQNENFIRLTGFVSLENNGGFVQIRKLLTKEENRIKDGIKIIARGNNSKYYIHLRTKYTLLPWQYYQAYFDVTENWKLVTLGLSAFKGSGIMLPNTIKPEHIKSIAIVAFGREHKVKLDVNSINFY